MNGIDKLKSRLGLGKSWDDEYLQEDDLDAEAQRSDYFGEQAARDAVGSTSSSLKFTESDTSDKRGYAHDSPFASGAAPSAVKKHARKPDLQRASEITGREVRDIKESRRSEQQPKVALNGDTFKPREFAEALLVADQLKEGKPVTVDLSLMESSQRQRFVDFMAGLVYALEGHLARAASNVYVLTPK